MYTCVLIIPCLGSIDRHLLFTPPVLSGVAKQDLLSEIKEINFIRFFLCLATTIDYFLVATMSRTLAFTAERRAHRRRWSIMTSLLCFWLWGTQLHVDGASDIRYYDPRVDVCLNRSLHRQGANCTHNYLPRFGMLSVGTSSHQAPRRQLEYHHLFNNSDGNCERISPPTPFIVLMQGGRVGSTWLTEILDSNPNVTCYGEGFNEHPCNDQDLLDSKFSAMVRTAKLVPAVHNPICCVSRTTRV